MSCAAYFGRQKHRAVAIFSNDVAFFTIQNFPFLFPSCNLYSYNFKLTNSYYTQPVRLPYNFSQIPPKFMPFHTISTLHPLRLTYPYKCPNANGNLCLIFDLPNVLVQSPQLANNLYINACLMYLKCIHELCIELLLLQSQLHHIRVISLFSIDFRNISQFSYFSGINPALAETLFSMFLSFRDPNEVQMI